MRARRVFWSHAQTSPVLRIGPHVYIAAPAVDSTGRTGVLVLRGTGGTWDRGWMPTFGVPNFAAISSVGGRHLVVAYTGIDTARSNPSHIALFAAVSRDGGENWSPPQVVERMSAGKIVEPRFVGSDDRRLVLAWLYRPNRPDGTDSIIIAASSDSTLQWRRIAAAAPGRSATGLQIIAGPRDAFHAIVMGDGGDRRLVYVYLQRGRAEVRPLSFRDVASLPILVPWRAGSLLLAWGLERSVGSTQLPVTYAAIGTAPCGR